MARFGVLDFEQERRPAIPVPELRSVDLVPARHLSRLQQIENGRRVRPTLVAAFVAEAPRHPVFLIEPEAR